MDEGTNKRHSRHLSPTGHSLHHRQSLPFLPDELISHILLWLPIRTLLEFKRVCKSWKTIISDPQFANNHIRIRNLTLNPAITHPRLFCCLVNQRWKIVSFPLIPLFEYQSRPTQPEPQPVKFTMQHKFHIIGSCNGLLCLYDKDQSYVKLWNPSIGFQSNKSSTLDCIGSRIKYYGFGYDHVNDKYKALVSLSHCREGTNFYETVTQIYTFGEKNCWTTIKCSPRSTHRTLGLSVSGTLNWMTLTSVLSPGRTFVIISFDLEKETFKELLLPENDGVKTGNHVLGVFSNCLCVCFDSNKTHWNLWVMKKYGVVESWTRLTMISYEQLPNLLVQDQQLDFIKPLFILENGIVLMSRNTKFMLLNLNNGRLDECLPRNCYIGTRQHIYYESLVSLQI